MNGYYGTCTFNNRSRHMCRVSMHVHVHTCIQIREAIMGNANEAVVIY